LFTCPYFKPLYLNQAVGQIGNFLGEPFKKISSLPNALITSREIGTLGEFPEEIYNPEIKIYPKRIAIIDLTGTEMAKND
jgi:hypothetical protein